MERRGDDASRAALLALHHLLVLLLFPLSLAQFRLHLAVRLQNRQFQGVLEVRSALLTLQRL